MKIRFVIATALLAGAMLLGFNGRRQRRQQGFSEGCRRQRRSGHAG